MGFSTVDVAVYFIEMPPQPDWFGRMVRWFFQYHVAVLIMWPDVPVFVQPAWTGIKAFAPHPDRAHWLYDGAAADVIVVTVDLEKRERFDIDILTCVNVVKRIIGLHDWRVQTPRQLLRALLRRNGR